MPCVFMYLRKRQQERLPVVVQQIESAGGVDEVTAKTTPYPGNCKDFRAAKIPAAFSA